MKRDSDYGEVNDLQRGFSFMHFEHNKFVILNLCVNRQKLAYLSVMFLSLFILFLSVNAQAAVERSLASLSSKGKVINISLSDSHLRLTALNENSVEVLYTKHGSEQTIPSFALPSENKISKSKLESPTWLINENDKAYELKLEGLKLVIDKQPFKLHFFRNGQHLSSEEQGFFQHETIRGFRFLLDDEEQIMGGGQRLLGMDRRGHRMPLYNRAHYGYTTESNQMYYSLSAVMSNKAYSISFDNSANGYLDIGYTESNILQFEAEAGRTSYIFTAGSDQKELTQNFVSATGKQPLPPRWALGNYASRFGYRSQQEVMDIVAKFEQDDIPLDTVIIDLYWFGSDIKGYMGNLSWDKDKWPEPQKMISTLRQKGIKTILITEPFILSTSTQWESAVEANALALNLNGKAKQFDFYFGNTGLVDVFSDQGQDWFWKFYEGLNEQGVAGWWGDLGEPEVHPAATLHNFNGRVVTANEVHNAYGHQWAKMVYERQLRQRPNERPFVMMRSGFIGSQRFGLVPWTGDVDRSWGGLSGQVELALQMGVFGLAYTHSDLGGFAGGETFDAELYTRWLQYGVFQPVYRPHAQEHIAPEPVFHDQKTKNIVRSYIKLRYSLLPYNYSLSMENSLYGTPLMRPLFMEFPDEPLSRTDAYMWGSQFLVAPIIEAGQYNKAVYLPKGIWFDYWTHEKHKGGQIRNIEAPLESLPVLVKAGAFIPSVPHYNNIEAYSTDILNLDYFSDATVGDTRYNWYEDDGQSPNSLSDKQFQNVLFEASDTESSLHIKAKVQGSYEGAPLSRTVQLKINGLTNMPGELLINGQSIVIEQGTVSTFEPLQSDTVMERISDIQNIEHMPTGKSAIFNQTLGSLFITLNMKDRLDVKLTKK